MSVGIEIFEKTSGTARYAADMLDTGTVVAGFVRSPLPHARILRIDVAEARAMHDVLDFLVGADFEGFRLGNLIPDEPVLAEDRVRYVGEPVAAIAARDADALRHAVAAVKVYYEELPTAFTPAEGLELGVEIHDGVANNVAHVIDVERGDFEEEAQHVDVWVEGEFHVQPMQHAYMEPYSVLAEYLPEKVILHTALHMPHMLRDEYRVFWDKTWDEPLEIRTPYIGGSFGAKYDHPAHLVCAHFARRLRRNVAMVMSRREDFMQATPRLGMSLRMRIGATSDGSLLVKQTEVLADNGAYSLHAPSVMGAATIRMDNLYRWHALRAHADLVYTNTLPTQCFRGFGSPQSGFAQEQLIDKLARKLGLDPVEIRRRNAVRPGERTIHDWRLGSCGLSEALDAVAAAIAEDRQSDGEDLNQDPRFVVGYGVAAGTHVISDRSINPPGDGAWVRAQFEPDGRLHLFLSEVEIGGGTIKTMRTLLANAVGIEADQVAVTAGDTEATPYGLGSWASRTTLFTGNAVLNAAQNLLARLSELRRELGLPEGADVRDIVQAAIEHGWLERTRVDGEFISKDVEVHDPSWRGNVSPTYTFGVHGAKVRVDTATGKVEVLRYWAAHDSGHILNPAGARGQVFGGVAQGLGYALSEGVQYDDSGRVMNAGFLDYRVPTFTDAVDTRIIFIETRDGVGPLGAKSIAEPPIIPVAACIANAVRDATGVRIYRLPITPENVFTAIEQARR